MWRCVLARDVLARVLAAHRCTAKQTLPPPPFLPGVRSTPPRVTSAGKLPPPPPLPGAVIATAAANCSALPWKSPQEVLSAFVDFVPTFFVPIHCVAAILSEDCRKHFIGRGRFLSFMKRYRFFFDLQIFDGVRCLVKLRDDVSHPRRGVADEKFVMTDVGEVINYVAKPEYIVSTESIEQANASVALKPVCAPPSVHVRLEERVPVLERLKALVPVDFALLDHVEEDIPEDVLFHPYFDCQGGLISIASKFPEFFQVVDGMIRRRPPHLAPLALNDYTLEQSPIPDVAGLVKKHVFDSDIPRWVSITSLYEQLTKEQKHIIKREYKSFAGFLRSHGRSLSLSQDMLQVAKWIPQERKATTPSPAPPAARSQEEGQITEGGSNAADAVGSSVLCANIQYEYTHTHIINELFDRFPPQRTLNLLEFLELVTPEIRPSLPKKLLAWLASYPSYFVVDDPTEKDPQKVRIRRASDRQPLDVAFELYQCIPEEGICEAELLKRLPEVHREYVKRIGLQHIVGSLPEWLALTEVEGTGSSGGATDKNKVILIKRLQTEVELGRAIHSKDSRLNTGDDKPALFSLGEEEIERMWPKLKYEGTMSQQQQRSRTNQRRGSFDG